MWIYFIVTAACSVVAASELFLNYFFAWEGMRTFFNFIDTKWLKPIDNRCSDTINGL